MSTSRYPSVEVIQRTGEPAPGAPSRGRRWKLFVGVLVAAAAVGLAFVHARTPVYRASVSVLTVKPKAVDMDSAAADVQHQAIQARLLLGDELLGRLSGRLHETGIDVTGGPDALRGILSIEVVPETNLLELRAQGEDPEQLQRVVNEWAGVYEALRLEAIEIEAGRTNAELTDEQRKLQERIDAARAELAAFRDAHDIVSLEREENRKISALKGINRSLNAAREQLVKARAHQTAIENAIARGDTVVPREQKSEIAQLRVTIARESARLAALRAQYTDHYISKDPKYRDLPETLESHRQELEAALEIGRTTVLDDARRETEAARVSLAALEQQLDADQKRVQLFTERFNEFKVLEENLAILERLHAEREQRRAQIEVKDDRKYPPMQVVEPARVPREPIFPDYRRDSFIALAAALGIALFVTWLVEYLAASPGGGSVAPVIGVRVSHDPTGTSLPAGAANARLRHQPGSADGAADLESPGAHRGDGFVLRELTVAEVESLLDGLGPVTGALATLLMSGLSPFELAMIEGDCFDRGSRRVTVPGSASRSLELDSSCWQRVVPLLDAPQSVSPPVSELDLRIARAAGEAGIADPTAVTALVLWHTYAAYLVRQGIDDAALTARVGILPNDVLQALRDLEPAPGGPSPDAIEYTYPPLLADRETGA